MSRYGITEISHGVSQTKAWRVTLYRNGSKLVEREFPFASNGGREAALVAAEAFRDAEVLKSPPEKSSVMRERLRASNTSGIPGVSEQTMGRYTYWVAQTKTRDGKKLSAAFRVELYGADRARELAIEARQNQLKQVEHRIFKSQEGEVLYRELLSTQGIDHE